MLRVASEFELGLDLRAQPRHRARARAGDRLQPVHRLPLPRGDRAHGPGPAGDAAHAGDRRPHRAVQLADGRRRRSRRCSSSRSASSTRWGSAASLVALIAAAVSLIVLPAVLTLLGTRVNALAPAFLRAPRRAPTRARPATGFWYRLSQFVMRFPGRIAIASAALLIVLGIPFSAIEFTSVDAQVLPERASARQVDDALRADFPPVSATRRSTLAVDGDAGQARAGDRARRLRAVAGVAAVGRAAARSTAATRDRRDLGRAAARRARARTLVERSARRSDGDAVGDRRRPPTSSTSRTSLADHLPLALAIVVDRDARRPVRDDRLGRAAGQAAADERARPERRLRDPRARSSRTAARGPARLHQPGRRSSRPSRSSCSRSCSACRPTTGCSCCRGSRRRATAARRTPRRRDRARADRPHRHRRRAAVRGRDRRLRRRRRSSSSRSSASAPRSPS